LYRKPNNGQLSIVEFHLPFGGKLDPGNRWVLLSVLFPWQELAETYAPQINATIGAPAKLVRLAFGSLCTKQPMWLTE
jgi:transposase, IS5 family